ncbi:MAG TPA: transcription termination factor Rho [Deltaproteobacteria bacterium]|nr:transcription termination factor Rho [Deltaproteobacteria bacterium]
MTEEGKKKQHKEEKPLDKMTVKELKEVALEIPHDHAAVAVSDMKKDELLAFIKEARGIVDEEPVKKKKKAQVKVALTKPEIKAKIKKLRQEKKAAQTAEEKKKAKALRHRISRLKKQSRKIA